MSDQVSCLVTLYLPSVIQKVSEFSINNYSYHLLRWKIYEISRCWYVISWFVFTRNRYIFWLSSTDILSLLRQFSLYSLFKWLWLSSCFELRKDMSKLRYRYRNALQFITVRIGYGVGFLKFRAILVSFNSTGKSLSNRVFIAFWKHLLFLEKLYIQTVHSFFFHNRFFIVLKMEENVRYFQPYKIVLP